jgi:isoleucyl-tRNA synthetase
MYKKVPTNMSFVEREKEVLQFWQDNTIFKRSIELRADGPDSPFSMARRRPMASRTSAIS